MSIGLKSVGTWATSTSTTMTVTLPTHAAGDLLIVRAIRKPFTSPTSMVINTSGWAATGTPFANGSTANGAGVGSMAIATFWKIASSSSETNPVVTWGATAAPGAAVALVYERTNEFYTWSDPIGVGGLDSNAATTINDTLGTHISVAAGDMVDIFCGWCDDSGTPSAVSISQPSVTYSVTSDVPDTALDTSTSNDLAADGGYALATAGTSSGAATITASYGSSEQHIVWMTRLRETAPTPTQTSVAEVSLASVTDPADNTSHSLHVRARVTSGTGRMRMALYEGANNRSGDLESGDLTTSLADYSLPISEANAANITDYSDLSVRFWGYSVNGGSIVYEVDQIWFELPESSTPELSGTTSTSSTSSTVVTGGGQRSGSASTSSANAATVVGAGARSGSASGISNTSGIVVTGRLAASGTTSLSNTSGITSTGVKEGRSSSSTSASNATSVSGNSARASAASTSSASGTTASGSLGASGTVGVSNSSGVSVSGYKAATPSTTSLSHASSATTAGVRSSADSATVSHESDATASGDAYRASTTSATHASASSASGSSTRSSATSTGHSSDATVSGDRQSLGAATSSDVISTSSMGRKDTSGTTSASHVSDVVVDGVQLTGGQAVISHTSAVTMAGTSGRSGSTSASAASDAATSTGTSARSSGATGISNASSATADGTASESTVGTASITHNVSTSGSGYKSTSSVATVSGVSGVPVSGSKAATGFLGANAATSVVVSGSASEVRSGSTSTSHASGAGVFGFSGRRGSISSSVASSPVVGGEASRRGTFGFSHGVGLQMQSTSARDGDTSVASGHYVSVVGTGKLPGAGRIVAVHGRKHRSEGTHYKPKVPFDVSGGASGMSISTAGSMTSTARRKHRILVSLEESQ